jgi:integrase
MASILKIGSSWRVQIRRKGHKPITETFPTKTMATEWAKKTEYELRGKQTSDGIGGVKLAVVIDRALEDDALGRTKRNVLEHLKEGLGDKQLDRLTMYDVTGYVNSRGYGPSTAQQEMSILGTTLNLAKVAWGYHVPDVMAPARAALKLEGKIKKSKGRERRPTQDEIDRLCLHFDKHSSWPMRDIIWFSIHTTMRASEVTGLLWADYSPTDKTIIIRDRKDPTQKIGNHQTVPLLDEAIEIIERQPRHKKPQYEDDESYKHIFPYNHKSFSSLFPRACQLMEPRIKDLRWHDLRHEGTSRLFERGYQIHEVALFTGHKDWKMLQRYTQLRAKDLRRL